MAIHSGVSTAGSIVPQFQGFNRNKQSIVVDLEQSEERAFLARMLETADVYIQNFRPGVAEKLGLGPAELQAKNPRLIYCAISGFGRDGPYAKRPTYDTVAQAMSGYLSMFVMPDNPHVIGPAVADGITGLYAAYGILGALVERNSTGRGRIVEVAMVEAMMHFAIEQFAHYFNTGHSPDPFDRSKLAQSYALVCADDKLIALHLSSPDKFWEGLVKAVEHPELAQDPRFKTRMDRVSHQPELREILRPIFRQRDRLEWAKRLEQADVPYAPIYTLAEAIDDPQIRHLGTVRSAEHPTQGTIRTIRRPVVYDRDRAGIEVTAPPVLDEHGVMIRAAYGASTKAETK